MTTFYNHQKIEQKWQAKWAKSDLYTAVYNKGKKKYILDMFPYPSGAGLHVGHPEGYTATDIVARYSRMKGFNVLHPLGYDSFGLPAENYAIKKNVHPKIKTKENIDNFRRQIKALGFSYDWSREVVTSSPEYYKWTQWLFLRLYEKGLAYQKQAPVNWCDSCKTVLANEQVVDGKCERCENEVIQKNLKQWFFKVTEYADELLEKIDGLDWSDALKSAQKNWIGKSEGALIKFQVTINKLQKISKSQITNTKLEIEVFTTRPDTLFGATYMVVAPEHGVIKDLKLKIENLDEVQEYIKNAQKKNRLERTDLAKEKTGVCLKGISAINPATKKEIPIYVADYVLTDYGTGAIMAVPAHDERDFEFALTVISSETGESGGKFIKNVIKPKNKKDLLSLINFIRDDENEEDKLDEYHQLILQGKRCFPGEGILTNSDKFNGLSSEEAKEKITKFVSGEKKVQYKIRDWLVSRQRYWGAPIPIIYCEKCGTVPISEKDLPIELPDDVDFKPTGESPLKSSKSFHKVKCPKCGASARRESDTMDTFVCSSWYFLRYCDANNDKEAFSKKKVKFWMPVDLYIGGMEHAVGHLIYSRFIVKALRDMKYLDFDEPFLKIRNQGIILAEDSRKMSKRWGNVINPDDVVEEYGADTLRLYEMFMGPLEDMKPWNKKGIIGLRRFLEKVNKFAGDERQKTSDDIKKLLHKTIKKVTDDIEAIRFNTAISAMMIFINETASSKQISQVDFEKFLIILAPFAPHLCEEFFESFGHSESIFLEKWPEYNKKLIIDDEVTIAVQVNGKLRDTIKVRRGTEEEFLKPMILELENVKKHLGGKEVNKFIYIKDKLVNIVT